MSTTSSIAPAADSTAGHPAATPRPAALHSVLWLVAGMLCALAMWAYVEWVNVPYFERRAEARAPRTGYRSDLYPRWYGARELLLHGRNPYGKDVTKEIQLGFYGYVLDPDNPDHETDQQGFAYPVYAAFLLAPLALAGFDWIHEWFRWLLLALTGLAVPLWLAALRMKLDWPRTVALSLLAATSFGTLQGAAWEQLSLLVAFIVAGGLALLAGERYAAAGLILAVAMVKPQLVGPLAAGLTLWAALDWRRRRGFVWGFGGGMAALLAGSELLLPGWIPLFLNAMREYQQYTTYQPMLTAAFGPLAGATAGLALVGATGWLWIAAGRKREIELTFDLAVAFTLATTLLVVPMVLWYNQVFLVPALLLLLRTAPWAWHSGRRLVRYAYFASIVVVGWQWIAALLLAVCVIISLTGIVSIQQVLDGWFLPLFALYVMPFMVPLPMLALIYLALFRRIGHAQAHGDRSGSP